MSRLKPSFVLNIREALEQSKFTPQDFEIELPTAGQVLVKIVFSHKSEYFLSLAETTKQERVTVETKYFQQSRTQQVVHTAYLLRLSPGEFKTQIETEISEPGDILREIPEWCNNIRADLYAVIPSRDPLEELRAKLNESIEGRIEDPNALFSEEELEAVDERFDKIFKEFVDLKEQLSLTQQQLSKIQAEFQEFKSSARVYPKGMWAKMTGNRFLGSTWKFVNTSEGRTFLFDQARRLLGQGD